MKAVRANLKTLIVDDNSMNLRILERTLSHHFSHLIDISSITKAADGFQALECMAEQSFDLILLDIDMPGMSGVQVARTIRKTDVDTIIIACTTSDSPSARELYTTVLMDGCVRKPLDLREVNHNLLQAVQSREYLNLHKESRSPDLEDRFLVHQGSLPTMHFPTRNSLKAPRSVSHSAPHKAMSKDASLEPLELLVGEDILGEIDSDCEHDCCSDAQSDISDTSVSETSSSTRIRHLRRYSTVSSTCACTRQSSVKRPRLLHTTSNDSVISIVGTFDDDSEIV